MDLARAWHLLTAVVVVVALGLQTALVVTGQSVIDPGVVTASLPERLRRLVSYFTIQSNLLVGVSVILILVRRTEGRLFRVVRLASLVGITVTGVVAAIALAPPASYSAANLLCDRLLHIAVPLLTVIGWIAFGPRGRVAWADVLPALAWPILWLAATLALGPVVGWYPYPFLDPGRVGLSGVAFSCAVIAALFVGLSLIIVLADRRLRPRA